MAKKTITTPATSSATAPGNTVADFIRALLASDRFGRQVSHHRVIPETEACFGEVRRPWNAALAGVLRAMGADSLYRHQAEACDFARAGRDIVVATPTASGKSLTYNLPVIERFIQDREGTSLYLFPLKALAQDQVQAFTALTGHWPEAARPKIAVYDGDTTSHFRRKIKNDPPNVLVTNPEMLHLGILPYHDQWAGFFAALGTVVVDEVHSYRGVLGAHMAQLFRRLSRVAALYGSRPAFVGCSATIGNPADLMRKLTGRDPVAITESGSPQGKRHFVFMNPEDSPSTAAIHLLRSALARGLRTIVYAQSRRMTELISVWAAEQSGPFAAKISAYRAGFLPEERREIEGRMASGDLLAVISTSALELGIDIGGLDLCILVGYPGTIMSTLQRGGRVGRSGRESAVVLIAQEDALDQYIVRNPEAFFASPPENAVVNPENPVILARHLECAAAEYPLKPGGADAEWLSAPGTDGLIRQLELSGELLRSADGATLHAARKRPQRHVDLRGAGSSLVMQDGEGNAIGSVDGHRALREAHPGAVYLHRGRSYVVDRLDLPGRTVHMVPGKPSYYTRTRGRKNTEILSEENAGFAWGSRVGFGRLRVTEEITGYEKRALKDGRLLGVVPLDLPPQVFETEGIWFRIPDSVRLATEEALMHFMGAIHAMEHAAIGILPLLVMADRNDLGGISTPMHGQLGGSAVFIYDGLPGGAGLARDAFGKARVLLEKTLSLVRGCPCESGCPACVHSPKCGSGNRPIDKDACVFLLEELSRAAPDPEESGPVIVSSCLTGDFPPCAPDHPVSAPRCQPGAPCLEVPLPETPCYETAGFETARPEVARPEVSRSDVSRPEVSRSDVSRPEQTFRHGVSTAMKKTTHPFMHAIQGALGAPPSTRGALGAPPSTQGALGAPPSTQGEPAAPSPLPARYGVLDVETRRSAAESGGWHRSDRMGVSVAVLYDSLPDEYAVYGQDDIPALAARLVQMDLVVGFNILRFDYAVLAPHAPGFNFHSLPTLDMLAKVHERLSYRISLDNLARATLNAPKSADGLMALQWWKEGSVDKIAEYCRMDVKITRDLYLFGHTNAYVLFTNKAGNVVRIPVAW